MKNYRVGYAAGGVIKKVIQGGKKISKKISDAARKQDTADRIKIFEQAGPHEGEVITKRILGKGTKKGDRTKAAVKDAVAAKPWAGKPHAEGGRIGRAAGGWTKVIPRTSKKLDFPGDRTGKPHSSREGRRDSWVRGAHRARKAADEALKKIARPKAGPQAPSRPKKTWPPKHSDLLRRFPKVPQPHKSPGDTPHIPNPRGKPGEKREYQPAAKGGRMGFKNGKSVFRRNPDRLEFTGKHGAKGAIPWNRKFKKRLSISDSPRQPKMLQPFKKGGKADKNWIQKATASIKRRKTKGKCTPITKPGCTGRAKALAKTFKKMAAKRKKA